MARFQGYLKHVQYYKIEVEAENYSDARDLMWDAEIDWEGCCDMDNEIVDVEEITE